LTPNRTIVHEFETAGGSTMQVADATERDAELLWSWWNTPEARRNWSMDYRLSRVGSKPFGPGTIDAYLRYCQATGFVRPYLVLEFGIPIAYLETYTAAQSPLAHHPRVAPTDCGMHLIMAEQVRHTGTTLQVGVHVIDWLFDTYPDMSQMLSDPSVLNVPAQILLQRAGLTELDRIDLGYKQAVIYTVRREDWSRLRAAAGR
jgi:RimJ/RimL family protein N-acetyltransferase